jgi:hypothetical protein
VKDAEEADEMKENLFIKEGFNSKIMRGGAKKTTKFF